MAFITKDRVLESTTSTGTSTLTLAGALAGYRAFSSVLSVGDTCSYAVFGVDSNGTPTGEFETGVATYSASATLTRTRVDDGSSGPATLVSFSAGTKYVALAVTAQELRNLPSCKLAADYTNSTTTLSDITGWTFDAEAGAVYEVSIIGSFTSAATTTGVGFALTVPTGTTVTGQWEHPGATTQVGTVGSQNATAAVVAKTSGVPTANALTALKGWWHVVTSTTAGTIKMQGVSEIASSLITLKAGSVMKIRRIA